MATAKAKAEPRRPLSGPLADAAFDEAWTAWSTARGNGVPAEQVGPQPQRPIGSAQTNEILLDIAVSLRKLVGDEGEGDEAAAKAYADRKAAIEKSAASIEDAKAKGDAAVAEAEAAVEEARAKAEADVAKARGDKLATT